ncbi:hypothetical protein MKleb_5609 (plasmid) [Klebsiella sp. PL-2018]|nr:hypothetical protein MKleb_5609 [Klebsiella sp. PL-2018]
MRLRLHFLPATSQLPHVINRHNVQRVHQISATGYRVKCVGAHFTNFFGRENEGFAFQVTGEMTFTANAGDVQNLLLRDSGVGQHRSGVASVIGVVMLFCRRL